MEPEQQTPYQKNKLDEPPQPAVFGGQPSLQQPYTGEGKKPRGRKKRWLPWVLSGVLLALVVLFGLLWFLGRDTGSNKKDSSSTPTQKETTAPAQTDEECAAKQRRYRNESLGLAFCYPTAWGDVSVADAKFDPSDSGSRMKLSFANKSNVHIGLVSDDWTTQVARDGTCADLAVQAFPDTSAFSAKWVTEGNPVHSATRGLEILPNEYLIQEHVDSTLTNGVCLEGYKVIDDTIYRNVAASYSAAFGHGVTTPQAHINDPTMLIPVADRTDFIALVKSFHKI